MAVSKRTRFEVLRRDDYTCRYCHRDDVPLRVDHVIPTALGGSDDPGNLVASCQDCNAGKASSSPDETLVAQVDQDAIRWAAALQLAAERVAAERAGEAAYANAFLNAWTGTYLPNDWEGSIRSMRGAGLPVEELVDAVNTALSARYVESRFRYFCGVAWRRVARLQDIARQIIDETEA